MNGRGCKGLIERDGVQGMGRIGYSVDEIGWMEWGARDGIDRMVGKEWDENEGQSDGLNGPINRRTQSIVMWLTQYKSIGEKWQKSHEIQFSLFEFKEKRRKSLKHKAKMHHNGLIERDNVNNRQTLSCVHNVNVLSQKELNMGAKHNRALYIAKPVKWLKIV